MEKIDLNLTGIPKTLLLPLWARACFSLKPYSPIHDALSIQLIQKINFDFQNLSKKIGNMTLFWVARANYFDQAIRHFLELHPDGTIVNLGAGLETAFYRIDNRRLQWIDIDLPEVINIRKELLPQHTRVHMIAKSLLDYSWMEDVKKFGKHFFFFAGGVFMYFAPEDVEGLLITMSHTFPGSDLVFDAISEKSKQYSNKLLTRAEFRNAEIKWAINEGYELEKWSPNIKVCKEASYFSHMSTRFDFPIMLQLKMLMVDIMHYRKIIHLRYVNPL